MPNRIVGSVVRWHLWWIDHRRSAVLPRTLAQCPGIADRLAQCTSVPSPRHLRWSWGLRGWRRSHRRRQKGLHRPMAGAPMFLSHLRVLGRVNAVANLVQHRVVDGLAHILDGLLRIDGRHDLKLARAHLVSCKHANLSEQRQ